ncbi:DUF6733 family protein [Tunicatimonas pelagia]|uniref:DUF6733 family protein n=1 Tax=Tunicatimonas pelagia TaxID=931531 RepID=UPI0026654F98|nr:DUF6733 family protein [Tunicatimonas pelagia]WKN42790.1 hypothetical protein P0M28_27520 [Tunicatimonas pelagia]
MKRIYTLFLLSLFTFSAFAQDEEDNFDMSVSLNSDLFFGFYPFFAGSYGSGSVDFTFYGILWSGGTGGGTGEEAWGNWTEVGVGVGFPVGDALYVSPQIGLLNGSLTSGTSTPVLAEGIVPNLTVGLDTDILEGELYAGYYVGFDHASSTSNFLHYWLSAGYKLNSFLSFGLHLEQLNFTGGNDSEDDAGFPFYVSLGPYVQFADPKGGAFARFITGGDLRSDEQVEESGNDISSFYKLSVGYSF